MRHFLLFIFCLGAKAALAGHPESILPKTKTIHPIQWYADQAVEWQAKILQEEKNAENWFNYFIASRYALKSADELTRIAADMERQVPGSYELELVQAWNAGYSHVAEEKIQHAYLKRPSDPASYSLALLLNEFSLNESARREFSKRLFDSGLVSESLLNYSYNVLMSVEPQAILFSEGENTTLPLYVLQDVMGIRRDVTIINLDMIQDASYRERKFAVSHIHATYIVEDSKETMKKQFCAQLPQTNPDRIFYYALTLSGDNIDGIKDQLYVMGLASRLSTKRIDNISAIRENLEKKFLLDYLTVDFNGENEWAAGRALNSNYLVPMLLLDDEYNKGGDVEKSRNLEQLVVKLAKEGGKTEMINSFLNRTIKVRAPFVLYALKIKELDESFKLIKGNLYAQKTEATNEQYNDFLKSLKNTQQVDLLAKYAFDLSQYTEPAASFMRMYSTPLPPVDKHENFFQHPAINISFESTQAYCEWLTEQYNNSPKRKFHKVKFRLPTLAEWQIAALGDPAFKSWTLDENSVIVGEPEDSVQELSRGKKMTVPVKDVYYPWWGAHNYRKKAQNHRNCWLGNFKVPDECKPCAIAKRAGDGFEMMAPVGMYFPNAMGFYDVVGNVAEMIDEKGKACGGSWKQLAGESTIRSVSSYSGPDAAVGFRVFMEVIEP